MKKFLLLLGLLAIGSCVFAVPIGVEPPAEFMTALRTCTKGTYNAQEGGLVVSYTIKGKTQTGRCIVEYSDYTDFSNKETYEGFVSLVKSLGGEKLNPSDIPTQEQMIEQGLKEKDTMICKFNSKERERLYAAYKKHDGNPTTTTKNPDGSTKYSFDSNKMSSYDSLMFELSLGPCEVLNSDFESLNVRSTIYACEYSDTTCYVNKSSSGGMSATCSPEKKGPMPWNTIEKHVNSGMCEKL